MRIIDSKCPNCGSAVSFDKEQKFAVCNSCGSRLILDDNLVHLVVDDAERIGYDFERGRQRAQNQYYSRPITVQPSAKKNDNGLVIVVVVLVVIFVPALLFSCIAATSSSSRSTRSRNGSEARSNQTVVEEEFEDVSLLSLSAFTHSPSDCYYPFAEEYNRYDIDGNKYDESIRAFMGPPNYNEEYSISYDLDGEYNSFTFTVALPESVSNVANDAIGTVRVYGDNSLLYQYENILAGSHPSDERINVSGVQTLRIEMYAFNDYSIMICDPVLHN